LTAKALGLELNLKPLDLHHGEHLKPEFVKVRNRHVCVGHPSGFRGLPRGRTNQRSNVSSVEIIFAAPCDSRRGQQRSNVTFRRLNDCVVIPRDVVPESDSAGVTIFKRRPTTINRGAPTKPVGHVRERNTGREQLCSTRPAATDVLLS